MYIEKIKNIIQEYKNITGQKEKPIGSILKYHRREKNITLEEATNNICSISYLCKVEKNQLIPQGKILSKLMGKLEIDAEELKQEKQKWVENILRSNQELKDAYKKVYYQDSYKSTLIKFAYSILILINNNLTQKYYFDLLKDITYFSQEEMSLFLYLLMRNFYNKEQYSTVIALYDEVLFFIEEKTLFLKMKILIAKAYYKLEKTIEATKLYNELVDELLNNDEFHEIIDLRGYEIANKAKILNLENFKNYLKTMNNIPEHQLNYSWGMFYYKNFEHQKACFFIEKIAYMNPHFYIIYFLILDKLKDDEKISECLNEKIRFKYFPNSYKIIMKYLKYKYLKNESSKFVQEEILIAKFITEEAIIVNYLYPEACSVFKKEHHYKKTVYLLEKYNKYLKQLK